jgi:hypothetical protein
VSWESTQAVILHSRSKKSARTVMLVLAFHARADGSGARLYLSTLGAEVGLRERQLRNVLHELEALGELRWKRGRGFGGRYGQGEGTPSEFTILLPHRAADREVAVLHRTGNLVSSNRQSIAASNPAGEPIEPAISDRRSGNFPSSNQQFSASPLKEDEQDEQIDTDGVEAKATAHARESQRPSAPPVASPDRGEDGSPVRPVTKAHSARGRGADRPPDQPTVAQPETTLPPDFKLTGAMLDRARETAGEHRVSLNAQLLSQKFLLYYRRGKGKDQLSDDWEAKWDRWVLDEIGDILAKGHSTAGHKLGASATGPPARAAPSGVAHGPPSEGTGQAMGKPVVIDREKLRREHEEKQANG